MNPATLGWFDRRETPISVEQAQYALASQTLTKEAAAVREEIVQAGRYARFLPVALAFAVMSKDPSTKVGALVLGPGREVRSSGWNGAPRGSSADEDLRFQVRPEKYFWSTHAEANAIANAARSGTPLEGCALVCTHAPCMGCAKLIVQAGITRVVYPKPDVEFAERWKEDLSRAARLFAECGVAVVELDP